MTRDFDANETEFLSEIDGALANLRANAGPCPHPDLLMAAVAGVRMDSSERIHSHLDVCPLCQQLTRNLSEYEDPSVSEEEDRRIRARWEPRRGWIRRPYAIGALAAVLLAAIALVVILRQGAPQQNLPASTAQDKAELQPTPAAQPAESRTAFVLSKAAIKVPAAAVLTFRSGSEDSRPFLNEFASALEPYRGDDFAEAAQRLGPLALKYRESAEVHFYLGVSRLFLNQNSAALESLQAARGRANENLRDDISWYVALAFDRAGRADDARREIAALCSRPGDYQKQACSSLGELR